MLYYKSNGRKEIRGHHAPESTSGRVGLTGPSPVLASKSPIASPPALPGGVQDNLRGRESQEGGRSSTGSAVRRPEGNWI